MLCWPSGRSATGRRAARLSGRACLLPPSPHLPNPPPGRRPPPPSTTLQLFQEDASPSVPLSSGGYAPPGAASPAGAPVGSPLAFGGGPGNTLDEPIWDTAKRDLKRIYKNLVMVVFPFKDRSQQSAALRNWDLWGPMVRRPAAAPGVFNACDGSRRSRGWRRRRPSACRAPQRAAVPASPLPGDVRAAPAAQVFTLGLAVILSLSAAKASTTFSVRPRATAPAASARARPERLGVQRIAACAPCTPALCIHLRSVHACPLCPRCLASSPLRTWWAAHPARSDLRPSPCRSWCLRWCRWARSC